jgi:hypothetical protein
MSQRKPHKEPTNETAQTLAPAITIDFSQLSEQTVKVIAAYANEIGCTPNEAAREILARVSRTHAA